MTTTVNATSPKKAPRTARAAQRVYVAEHAGTTRLVSANTSAQTRNYIAGQTIKVRLASAAEVGRMMASGVKLENADGTDLAAATNSTGEAAAGPDSKAQAQAQA
jgi:hypothetical protein